MLNTVMLTNTRETCYVIGCTKTTLSWKWHDLINSLKYENLQENAVKINMSSIFTDGLLTQIFFNHITFLKVFLRDQFRIPNKTSQQEYHSTTPWKSLCNARMRWDIEDRWTNQCLQYCILPRWSHHFLWTWLSPSACQECLLPTALSDTHRCRKVMRKKILDSSAKHKAER